MGRATEDQLAALHRRVAESMLAALDQSDKAAMLLVEYGSEVPQKVRRFLEDVQEVSPSLLTSATKFLKDNNISCDPSEDNNLSELEEKLKQKRKANVAMFPLADD